MRAASVAALALFTLLVVGAPSASAFEVGYNVAWIEEAYGSDFTSRWDEGAVDLALARTKAFGGGVARLWLFEGQQKDGAVFASGGTRATGLAPHFLERVQRVCEIARRRGVKIYWTGMNGNYPWSRSGQWANIHFNILNDKYGEAQSFRTLVLGPVLDVLARNQDTVYAYDVMNEVEGSVATWFWPDAWTGARRWMRDEVAFVHARLPGVAVTASAGWDTAAKDLAAGRFSSLGLDFYDLHVYDDAGRIPEMTGLTMLQWRTATPILLGEFGQKTARVDDALQRRATAAFLENARAARFLGALGWRLDDERPAVAGYQAYHSYVLNDRERPVVADVRAFVARVGADSRSAMEQVRAWRAGRP